MDHKEGHKNRLSEVAQQFVTSNSSFSGNRRQTIHLSSNDTVPMRQIIVHTCMRVLQTLTLSDKLFMTKCPSTMHAHDRPSVTE